MLPLNTDISVYVRTKKCYNDLGSKTNYFLQAYPTVLAFCESYSGGQAPNKATSTNRKFNWMNIRGENPKIYVLENLQINM